jgi:hypothetical protein
MTIAGSGALAGTVRWAVVPYSPRPPFRLYAGQRHAPITIPDPANLIDAARKRGDAELTYLVPGKTRPVLILNDPPAAHHQEITALRLLRLSKLTLDEQARVRRQDDLLLFHLPPDRFRLPEESAAMVSALVRVHADAVDATSLGELNPNETRIIGERIIGFYGFDTRLLVERQIRRLAERRRRPKP